MLISMAGLGFAAILIFEGLLTAAQSPHPLPHSSWHQPGFLMFFTVFTVSYFTFFGSFVRGKLVIDAIRQGSRQENKLKLKMERLKTKLLQRDSNYYYKADSDA
jgi:hypothetical protein